MEDNGVTQAKGEERHSKEKGSFKSPSLPRNGDVGSNAYGPTNLVLHLRPPHWPRCLTTAIGK